MIFHCVLLFLLSITVWCENVPNSSTFQLQSMVIAPYQRVFTIFNSDIVDKLTNINLTHVNHSFSNLAYEFHCKVEEIQLDLQQTALNNQILLNQVTIHINELLELISRFENETERTEILMNELNKTVDAAQELVDVKEKAATQAIKYFSKVVHELQDFGHRRHSPFNGYKSKDIFNRHNDRNRFSPFESSSSTTRYHFGIRNDPFYQSSAKSMHEAHDELKKQKQQLEKETVKFNATKSHLRNISQQLLELNRTLQQRLLIEAIAAELDIHLQLIVNHLKTVSTSSKRLIDVLMYVLDYGTVVKPLNSIYEKLFSENMIESTDLKLSKEIMEKIRQKLLLLSVKLPEIRYRRKQFHQPCQYR